MAPYLRGPLLRAHTKGPCNYPKTTSWSNSSGAAPLAPLSLVLGAHLPGSRQSRRAVTRESSVAPDTPFRVEDLIQGGAVLGRKAFEALVAVCAGLCGVFFFFFVCVFFCAPCQV